MNNLQSGYGPLVLMSIGAVLLVVGGFYFFFQAGSEKTSGEYGEKVKYSKGAAIQFPDFVLVYTGEEQSPGPNNAPWSMTSHLFTISNNTGNTKKIGWSSGAGDIGPNLFEFEGKKYTIERVSSDTQGKLANNEIVINSEGKKISSMNMKSFISTDNSFSFSYPEFKDWKVNGIENKKPDNYIMYFNWPQVIKYETAPIIAIEKSIDLGKLKATSNQNVKKALNGISYEYIIDPSQYIQDHTFKSGDWDWLVFYGEHFVVKIGRNMFGSLTSVTEKHNLEEFNSDLFYQTIIDSFAFDVT